MRLVLVILLVLFLTGCSAPGSIDQDKTYGQEYTLISKNTDADLDVTFDNPTRIEFGDEQTYIIDTAGEYILTGSCQGQIQIDVQDQIVQLVLDNVELRSPKGPAIYVKSAAKVVITIPVNSSSILMDSTDYIGYEDARACIFSEDDLTINGGGEMQVYGYCKDAVRTKDILKILDVSLSVKAKGTGLRGNDGVSAQNANLDLQCEGTGIYTEKENKEKKGFVEISEGSVSIIAGEYGIDAAQNVYIQGCVAEIYGTLQDILCLGEQYIQEGCLE